MKIASIFLLVLFFPVLSFCSAYNPMHTSLQMNQLSHNESFFNNVIRRKSVALFNKDVLTGQEYALVQQDRRFQAYIYEKEMTVVENGISIVEYRRNPRAARIFYGRYEKDWSL